MLNRNWVSYNWRKGSKGSMSKSKIYPFKCDSFHVSLAIHKNHTILFSFTSLLEFPYRRADSSWWIEWCHLGILWKNLFWKEMSSQMSPWNFRCINNDLQRMIRYTSLVLYPSPLCLRSDHPSHHLYNLASSLPPPTYADFQTYSGGWRPGYWGFFVTQHSNDQKNLEL